MFLLPFKVAQHVYIFAKKKVNNELQTSRIYNMFSQLRVRSIYGRGQVKSDIIKKVTFRWFEPF